MRLTVQSTNDDILLTPLPRLYISPTNAHRFQLTYILYRLLRFEGLSFNTKEQQQQRASCCCD